jgi:transcriptional regulator with XRE-family HTH domain
MSTAVPAAALAAFRAGLKRHRETAGLSLRELASRAELSDAVVKSWEAGRSTPNVKSLYRVAHALRLPLSSLLADLEHALSASRTD